ncbi:sulfotransferase [Salinivibrio sp. ES.052]|uniref:sulfotransferase family protein n=1 Tax=Salinivibrio sp. ES.052 TaxID=1882823 RepID=UPI00092844DE|nr:sulfotransferase [Salinivibrio sp. ES.052]SIN79668.1 Sulfotransferase family protein [Salinivibrio sp. ES.052]
MRPNLYIVGGQKCGTSALAHFLAQHPDIALAHNKEAHVFDDPDMYYQGPPQWDKAYQKAFAHVTAPTRYYCDATPIYSYLTELLPRIAHYSPGARVIMMVRDPVERAISQYHMEKGRGNEHRSMLGAFLAEPFRLWRDNHNLALDAARRCHSYLDRGRFLTQFQAIDQAFGPYEYIVVHNDDLRYHHHETLARIFGFLDLPNHSIVAEPVFTGNYSQPSLGQKVARYYAKARLSLESDLIAQFKHREQ